MSACGLLLGEALAPAPTGLDPQPVSASAAAPPTAIAPPAKPRRLILGFAIMTYLPFVENSLLLTIGHGAKRGTTSSTSVDWSLLYTTRDESGLPIALQQQEHDDDRDNGQQGTGEEEVVNGMPARRDRLRAPLVQSNCEGEPAGVA